MEELKESYELYELAISAANIGVWDWKTSSDTVYYSKIWKAQVGYQEHELANNFETWENLLHPDEAKEVQQRVAEYIENPEGHMSMNLGLDIKTVLIYGYYLKLR